MNLCIVSFEAIWLAVILVQYNNINEVEAVKHLDLPTANWFSSVENNFENVQSEEVKVPQQLYVEKEEAPKKKRRIKKHKKKNKIEHGKLKHLPRMQTLDASIDQDKAEFSKRVTGKKHKKRVKNRINQRKFVKTLQKESNSSESDETQRRKPVDIIVHIKMND